MKIKREPERAESWHCDPDAENGDIPTLTGRFDNGWRFEIKPIEGQVYYNLCPPLDELDEWQSPLVEDWSFMPWEKTVDSLWHTLENCDSLVEMKDSDNFILQEFGRTMEMLEREGPRRE